AGHRDADPLSDPGLSVRRVRGGRLQARRLSAGRTDRGDDTQPADGTAPDGRRPGSRDRRRVRLGERVIAVADTPGLAAVFRSDVQRPLFSDDWHGISLESIAKEPGLPLQSIANEHFYDALYRRWKQASFKSDDAWVRAKKQIADLMAGSLRRFATPLPRILS